MIFYGIFQILFSVNLDINLLIIKSIMRLLDFAMLFLPAILIFKE